MSDAPTDLGFTADAQRCIDDVCVVLDKSAIPYETEVQTVSWKKSKVWLAHLRFRDCNVRLTVRVDDEGRVESILHQNDFTYFLDHEKMCEPPDLCTTDAQCNARKTRKEREWSLRQNHADDWLEAYLAALQVEVDALVAVGCGEATFEMYDSLLQCAANEFKRKVKIYEHKDLQTQRRSAEHIVLHKKLTDEPIALLQHAIECGNAVGVRQHTLLLSQIQNAMDSIAARMCDKATQLHEEKQWENWALGH
jgi:hypothetical protein